MGAAVSSSIRVVCISDTHLRRPTGLPGWCRAHLERADLILHAGDIVSRAVLDALERMGPLKAVRGNMDEVLLGPRLPLRRVAEIGGVKIGMLHNPGPARGRLERLATEFSNCDAIVYGHTHVPEIAHSGRQLVVNPGSPTVPRAQVGGTLIELTVSQDGEIEATCVSG